VADAARRVLDVYEPAAAEMRISSTATTALQI
jgi:hypothetical protein